MSKFELLTIDEIDTEDKYKEFTVDFVYNYFKKDERVEIDEANTQELNGQPLETVPRYVKINFERHTEYRGLNVFTDFFKNQIDVSKIEDMVEKAVLEENITPSGFYTLKLRDNEDVENFYNLEKSEILSKQQQDFTTSVTKNRNIINKEKLVEEKYTSSILTDTDFNQPLDESGYYMNLSNSFMGVFGKTKNLKVNTRIKRKYLDSIVKNLSKSPTSPYSNELLDIYENLTFIKNIRTQDTAETYFKIKDYDDYRFRVTKKAVVGYVIEKYEAIVDGDNNTKKVQRKSIYLKGTSPGVIIDKNVKYGATYEYSIKTVVAVAIDAVIEQAGEEVNSRLLKIFLSAGSNSRPIFCNERVPPKPPESLFFQYNFKEDAMIINWEFPFNKQQDIKRFQIYRRSSLTEPFSLLREYNFDDSIVTDSFSPSSGNKSNVTKLLYPKCFYFDHEFNEKSKFIYAVASIDARGLTSGYSDQFMVSYDRFINKTKAKFISRSGAPKPYPNIFLEIDALPDVIKTSNTDKIKIYFNPDCKKIKINEENANIRKQSFIDNNYGNYKIQLINTETQENTNITFSIKEEEFLTEEEILENKYGSTSSGL